MGARLDELRLHHPPRLTSNDMKEVEVLQNQALKIWEGWVQVGLKDRGVEHLWRGFVPEP